MKYNSSYAGPMGGISVLGASTMERFQNPEAGIFTLRKITGYLQ